MTTNNQKFPDVNRMKEILSGRMESVKEENEEKKKAESEKIQQGNQNMMTSPGTDGFTLPQQPGTTSINSLPSQGMQNMRESMESQQPQISGMNDSLVGGGIEAFSGF